MDPSQIVPTLWTVVASATGALIAVYLKDWIEERRDQRSDRRAERRMRKRTDRATYNKRLTILIRSNLGAYVRGGKWHSDESDLKRLLIDLENGNCEHFLDQDVERLWRKLVRKTVILAKRRLSGILSETDIRFYNVMRQEWEDAALRSFGPVPDVTTMPRPRRRDAEAPLEQAA